MISNNNNKNNEKFALLSRFPVNYIFCLLLQHPLCLKAYTGSTNYKTHLCCV